MAKAEIPYNNISVNNLRFLLKNIDQFNQEVADLTPLLLDNQQKLFSIDVPFLCWAPYYELSYPECVARFFRDAGLNEELRKIAKSDNQIRTAGHFVQSSDMLLDKVLACLPDDQRRTYILKVLGYGLLLTKSVRSLMVYGFYINDLVAIARTATAIKSRDEALLKAVRMDASVVGCPTASSRISKAVLLNDTKFLKKLNNAILGKLGVREARNFQKMRFILQVLHESGGVALNDKQLKDLFVHQLNLYSDSQSTSEKNLKAFAYNFKHQKSTI